MAKPSMRAVVFTTRYSCGREVRQIKREMFYPWTPLEVMRLSARKCDNCLSLGHAEIPRLEDERPMIAWGEPDPSSTPICESRAKGGE